MRKKTYSLLAIHAPTSSNSSVTLAAWEQTIEAVKSYNTQGIVSDTLPTVPRKTDWRMGKDGWIYYRADWRTLYNLQRFMMQKTCTIGKLLENVEEPFESL